MINETLPSPRLARAVEILRTEGLRNLGIKALGETFYRRLIVAERSLDLELPPISAGIPVDIELLDDPDEYQAFRPEIDADEIRRRLEAGHRCFVARHEGRIVAASWSATGRVHIDYLHRDFEIPPDAVYLYDSFTTPEFRGRNIPAFRGVAVARYWRSAGLRRLIGTVLPENHAGLRPAEKVGYHVIGVMGYIGVGRWRRHFYVRRSRAIPSPQATYWDKTVEEIRGGLPLHAWRAYMRLIYATLIQRWLPEGPGLALKTDVFEEAVSPHHVLPLLGLSSVGLDCSSAAACAARRRLMVAGDGSLLTVADLRAIPLRTGTMTRILSGSSLDHFASKSDITRSLRELARILKPGGTLVITFDNPHNPIIWLRNHLPFRWLKSLRLVPYYVGKTFTLTEACRELESAGLRVTEFTAVAHAPRVVAIGFVALAERFRSPVMQRFLASALAVCERLEQWPTRYITGHYLAFRAEKP